MGSNVTLVFIYDDNSDDEEASQMMYRLIDHETHNLVQAWTIEEEPVPARLTQRILDLL